MFYFIFSDDFDTLFAVRCDNALTAHLIAAENIDNCDLGDTYTLLESFEADELGVARINRMNIYDVFS